MKISVVIPAKDVAEFIKPLLDSIFSQVRKPDEVVIVDAGSKDKTSKIIQTYIAKGYPIKLIASKGAFSGKARNIAIKDSTGEVAAMTDSDTVVDKNWLNELAKPLENDASIDVVFGRYFPITDTYFQKCQAFVCLSCPQKLDDKYIYWGSFVSAAIRKKGWRKAGKFPEHLRAGEDTLFLQQIRNKELKIKYILEAIVYWRLSPNLYAMLKKTFIYTRCRIYWNINTSYVYFLTVTYLLGSFILLFIDKRIIILYFLGIAYRMIKNIKLQTSEFKKLFLNPLSWIFIPILFLTYDIMQVSGCIAGLVKKIWK